LLYIRFLKLALARCKFFDWFYYFIIVRTSFIIIISDIYLLGQMKISHKKLVLYSPHNYIAGEENYNCNLAYKIKSLMKIKNLLEDDT